MIRLGERAVDLALGTLRNHLQDALDALAAASADGIPAPTVESFYPFKRDVAVDDRCYVEVWCSRLDGFGVAALPASAGRSSCEATVNCRATFLNRAGLSEEALARTAHRLAAAMAAVFVANPLLEGTDYQLAFAPLDTVEIGRSDLKGQGAGQVTIAQATAVLRASLLECASTL